MVSSWISKGHHAVLCTCAHAQSTCTTPTLTLLYRTLMAMPVREVRSSIIIYIYMCSVSHPNAVIQPLHRWKCQSKPEKRSRSLSVFQNRLLIHSQNEVIGTVIGHSKRIRTRYAIVLPLAILWQTAATTTTTSTTTCTAIVNATATPTPTPILYYEGYTPRMTCCRL